MGTGGSELAQAAMRGAASADAQEELERLRAQLARTALLERAKGVLMERHGISEQAAADRLRRHARGSNLRLTDVAAAVLETHLLLREPAAGLDD